ncbi:MAG: hypothetical protein ACRC0R_00110 [Cetobacterium sp.]
MIQKLKKVITDSGYKYLGVSKEHKEIRGIQLLKFSCSCGHEFIDSPDNIVNNGISCSNCYEVYKTRGDDLERIRKIYDIYRNIIPIKETYSGSEKSEFKCTICGHIWNRRVLSNSGCPNCQRIKASNQTGKKSVLGIYLTEVESIDLEYKKLLREKYQDNLEVNYFVNWETPVRVKCNKCGNEWEHNDPKKLLRSGVCPKCSKGINLTIEKIRDNLKEFNYDVLSHSSRGVTVKCKTHGNVWISSYWNLKKGIGCQECYRDRVNLKSHKTLLEIINDGYGIVSINGYQDITLLCKVCNNSFRTSLKKIKDGKLCEICESEKSSLYWKSRTEDLMREHNPSYKIISKYVNNYTDVEVDCGFGHIFKDKPKYLVRGSLCTECNIKSKSENDLVNYIESLNFNVESKRFSTSEGRREIDAYIDSVKIGFEFNGIHWHSSKHKDENYHLNKTNIFKSEYGISIYHIREDDWEYKKDIVKSRISNILGKTENRIYARKCDIREVPKNVKDVFLDRYHIQGRDKSSIKLGLYYKDKLVSLMTFGKVRNSLSGKYDTEELTYELIRFSNRTNLSVVGGFSKLLKHSENVLDNLDVKRIKTFADRSWSTGNVYEKNGFKFSHLSKPNYHYIKNGILYSRQEFQKHKLSDKLDVFNFDLSERENMENNGYYRYYDCGNLVYYKDIIGGK